jgi:hypothetical protein
LHGGCIKQDRLFRDGKRKDVSSSALCCGWTQAPRHTVRFHRSLIIGTKTGSKGMIRPLLLYWREQAIPLLSVRPFTKQNKK